MKAYTIRMVRTYTTEVHVRANSIAEAEAMMNEMKENGRLYEIETEQCEANESIVVYPMWSGIIPKVGERAFRICSATGDAIDRGYNFGEGMRYFKEERDAMDYANIIGYDTLDEAEDDEAFVYEIWDDLRYEWNGTEWIEING